jgi:hypothetical protein
MTKEEIDGLLLGQKNEVLEAHASIVNLQKNEEALLLTGHKYLDDLLIGGLNNKMIFIGSRPSMGKTHHCAATINNLLDPEKNPCQDIKLLRLNLEMTTQALLLRELKKELKKPMKLILTEPYTEEEQLLVKQVVKKFQDKRVINFSKVVEGQELRYTLRKFVESVNEEATLKEKRIRKIVLVDHLHIYPDKASIDEVLRIANDFKMEDKDISFIFYFQFNRETEDMWRDSKAKKINPRNMWPHSGNIYLTDGLQQYADIIMGMTIPQVVDLEEFAAINKEHNKHLSNHFGADSDAKYVRLRGRNRIYYNFIKIRAIDDFEVPRIYAEILNEDYEKKLNSYKNFDSSGPGQGMPAFSNEAPTFGMTPAILNAAGSAFDIPAITKAEDLLNPNEEDDSFEVPF